MENGDLVFGYTGGYHDPVTGCYPLGNGYRVYFPDLMRFSAPDDWSPFGEGGINPYVYCDNDPINHADPSGHMSWLNLGLTIALTLGTFVDPALAPEAAAEDGALAGDVALNATREAAEREGVAESSGRFVGDAEPRNVLSGRPGGGEEEPGPSSRQLEKRRASGDGGDGPPEKQQFMEDPQAAPPARRRPTLGELIQQAKTHVGQHRGEVFNHWNGFSGTGSTDDGTLIEHQLARLLEGERTFARNLEGYDGEKDLGQRLGFAPSRYSSLRSTVNARIAKGKNPRWQKYLLHWFLGETYGDEDIELLDVG